jgi:hypothetical protein
MFHVNKGQVSIDQEILLVPEYKKIHDKWKDKSLSPDRFQGSWL